MNRKINSLIIGCIALTVQPIFAREVLTTDFFEGIPDSFTLEDRDGNTLSADVMKYGFSQGDAWVAYFIPGEKNMVAASTSWYAPSGTSDDRMILPEWEASAGDVLQWRARSSDKYITNGYKVVAQCAGEEKVLFSTDGENAEWTYRQVALDEFDGKRISLAFVDCSTDASLLFVDDIRLGTAQKIRAEINVPGYVTASVPFHISGFLTTDIASGIEGRISVRTAVNGNVQTIDLGDMRLTPGTSFSFKMPEAVMAENARVPMTLNYEISCNGAMVFEGEKVVIPAVNYAVCEEITGTWCAWCVRGIASFEKLNSLYPDSFIGIAIHDGDVMAEGVSEYKNLISSYGKSSGLPFAFMMRNSGYSSDFNKYESVVEQINEMPLTAFVETTVGDPVGNLYPLSTSVTLTDDMVDDSYRIAYILIENDVFDPEDADEYIQHNAYAGGENGPCGGFEDKPYAIVDMHYEHVARAYMGKYTGIPMSLPERMKRDNCYVSDNTLELPDNVLKKENCELITLLIDNNSTYIVAADKMPLIGVRNAVGSISVSDGITISGGLIAVPDGCRKVSVADISGRMVLAIEGEKNVDISSLSKGIYVVTVSTATGTVSRVFAIN